MAQIKRIALLGQPNSGKSTIFNMLTGSHQHVGNWPGKTVEKKEGTFTSHDIVYQVADLPGSYSLSANSEEEAVTRDYIAFGNADLVLVLADASQLERSLYMLADFAGINVPVMLVVTMIDVAENQGKMINIRALADKLGIYVTGVVAPDKKSYGDFYDKLEKAVKEPKVMNADSLYDIYKNENQRELYLEALQCIPEDGRGSFSKEWLASKLMEQDEQVIRKISEKTGKETVDKIAKKASMGALYTSDCKFAWIEGILQNVVKKAKEPSKLLTKFDRAAISKRWGRWIAVGIMLAGLMGSMVIAMPFMLIGGFLPTVLGGLLESGLSAIGVSESIIAFINGTLVLSLGWTISMLGFVFGINLVFGLIEEAGYMARVAYAFDSTMSKLGLQGKSIMPMVISVGCTIGGAAGTRVVDSWGQRILTMALVWAVPCGATFAVIPTLATAFFGWGGILVMVFLFAIMFVHIPVTAKFFGRKLNPSNERTGLIMELPPYHKPRWGFMFKQALNRVWEVFKKAFVIIVVVAAAFYLLAYSVEGGFKGSVLYKIGIAIEPVTRIFGMGWQTFMAFIASMVSKEAVLGVLSAIFANSGNIFDSTIGTAAADANLGAILSSVISKAEALAFMVAVTFNVPCLMAVSSTYQESHSLKWTLRIALYYIVSALLLSCIVYHVANLFM